MKIIRKSTVELDTNDLFEAIRQFVDNTLGLDIEGHDIMYKCTASGVEFKDSDLIARIAIDEEVETEDE